MSTVSIRVCNCGHPASEHLEGTGLGEGCAGDVIVQNPGQPDTPAPCSCEAFALWYVDTPGACPNQPRCPHPFTVHDIEDHDDPSPTCCVEGCNCGKGATDDRG